MISMSVRCAVGATIKTAGELVLFFLLLASPFALFAALWKLLVWCGADAVYAGFGLLLAFLLLALSIEPWIDNYNECKKHHGK